MALRVAINGFGRIGRLSLRSALEHNRTDLEFVAINDLGGLEANAHLLRYDSVHGRFPVQVRAENDRLEIDQQKIQVFSQRDPANLPWSDLGVDIVMECTGFFTSSEQATAHLDAGAKKVLISAPAGNDVKTIVYGVNHKTLNAEDRIVSNASCTTNCLAPVAKILHETVGIEKGNMTTIHAYTGDQPTLDAAKKDLYRARAAAMSMIPTSTGAAKAVGLVLPELNGRLDGSAVRVPTPNVSLVDLVFVASRATSADEVNDAMKKAVQGELSGILGYSDEPLVSTDFNHDDHSSTFAAAQTKLLGGDLVRVVSWYDNEWGFSTRMSDTASFMGSL